MPLKTYHLEIPSIDLAEPASSNLLVSSPLLASLLKDEFSKVFDAENLTDISSRQVEYWKSLNGLIRKAHGSNVGDEYFCNLELLLIERNFNSKKFVRYLTNRFTSQIEGLPFGDLRIKKLAYIQKIFNQIPIIKDLAYDRQYDDLSLTINNWFICEIEFSSLSNTEKINKSLSKVTKSSGYIKKTADKVRCKLTVDQLALFFKAVDLSNIISARSWPAVFQSVAPYLSTPHCAEIFHSSLRVKSYSVEDRDKSLLIEMMIRLTEQIKDLLHIPLYSLPRFRYNVYQSFRWKVYHSSGANLTSYSAVKFTTYSVGPPMRSKLYHFWMNWVDERPDIPA